MLTNKNKFFIIIENSSILKPVCVGGEEYPRGWKKKHVERGVKQGKSNFIGKNNSKLRCVPWNLGGTRLN